MISEFENLDQKEQDLMYRVPILVAILISGADGTIDKAEMREAITVLSMKKVKARKNLIQYYDEVGIDFADKLKSIIAEYPDDPKEREELITTELAEVNRILPKLNKKFAITLYSSLMDFAKRIAEASGGFLGYLTVGYEESKLIQLRMIKNPSQ